MPFYDSGAVPLSLLIYMACSACSVSPAANGLSQDSARTKKERSRRSVPLYVARHLPVYGRRALPAPFFPSMRLDAATENAAAALAQGLRKCCNRVRARKSAPADIDVHDAGKS